MPNVHMVGLGSRQSAVSNWTRVASSPPKSTVTSPSRASPGPALKIVSRAARSVSSTETVAPTIEILRSATSAAVAGVAQAPTSTRPAAQAARLRFT